MLRTSLLLMAAVLLAGCASPGAAPATITAQVPVTVTESVNPVGADGASPSAAISTPSSPVAAVPVPLGSTQTIPNQARVTAYSIDRNVPPEQYTTDASPRTALDIEVCLDAPASGVSSAPWSLTDASGGRYTADSYTSDPKLPEYPGASTLVVVGECIRGWLIIKAPANAAITGVRYGLQDGTVLRWSVPA